MGKRYQVIAFLVSACLLSSCRDLHEEMSTEPPTLQPTQSITVTRNTETTTIWQSIDYNFFSVFPETTRITKNIQKSFNGVTLGKTTLTELRQSLKEKKVAYDYAEKNVVSDISARILADSVRYFFDDNGVVQLISVGSSLETDRGAKIGDSEEKIIGLYGDGYQKRLYGHIVYEEGKKGEFDGDIFLEYTDGKSFLIFFFNGDKQLGFWQLSYETAMKEPPE